MADLIGFFLDPDSIRDICESIADGEPLHAYCARLGLRYARVATWLTAEEHRAERYANALAHAGDRLAHECIPIADGQGDVQQNKLRIDTRLKIAARWAPKRYGDVKSQDPIQIGGTFTIIDGPKRESTV